jgi:F-type H+-transporting ATPase subunit a
MGFKTLWKRQLTLLLILLDQLGESFYKEWIPFIGTLFFFVFGWIGLRLSVEINRITSRRLAAPTNDINTTVALALLTSLLTSMQV